MTYEPRRIAFLGREGRVKHYGIGDAHENEIHARYYAAPKEAPGALAPLEDTGMACVWELEVIDFERRAWPRDVLEDGDLDAYLARALEEALV